MNLSELCKREWRILSKYPTFIFAENFDDFYFDAGNKVIADQVINDHNQMLEANQKALELTLQALDKISELKGEENSQVDDYHIFESFIKLHLPRYLSSLNKPKL